MIAVYDCISTFQGIKSSSMLWYTYTVLHSLSAQVLLFSLYSPPRLIWNKATGLRLKFRSFNLWMFKTAVIILEQKPFYGEFFFLFSTFKYLHNRLKVSLLARFGKFTHDFQTRVWAKNVWTWVWLVSLKLALQQKAWKTIGESRTRESWTLEVVSFSQEKPRKTFKTDGWKSREFTIRCNP